MTGDGRARWSPTRLGIRSRTTFAAVLVVGIALVVAAIGLMALTRNRIEASIRDGAVTQAETLAALIEAGALTDPLPGRDLDLVAQVVDASGVVIAADRAAGRAAPFTTDPVVVGGRLIVTVDELFEAVEGTEDGLEDEGPYVVAVQGVAVNGGSGTVQVAASLEDAGEAVTAVAPALWIGITVLLVIVGVTTWALTGRALRPVEEMRSEADRISAAALDRRLPLPEAQDELRSLAATLNDMLERLEQSALRQRRFVADASHELKSPLTAMRAMVDVAVRDPDVAQQELLVDLDSEIDRMQRLVADMLYLARSDESPRGPYRDAVDVEQVVAAEGAALRSRSGVTVDTTALYPVRIDGDSAQIGQLVRNLTDNAARHAASTVWLSTGRRDGDALIVIRDDGPGISKDDRERVFERFVRLDESRARDTGGAGLGLAVARAIARDHGGDLVLVGADRGATFEARFPVRG
jgi:signal transduction histidine kinase